MYSDAGKRNRSVLCDAATSGAIDVLSMTADKGFPYSILSKTQPPGPPLPRTALNGVKLPVPQVPPPPSIVSAASGRNGYHLSTLLPMAAAAGLMDLTGGVAGDPLVDSGPASGVAPGAFYGNTMVTDVGICFSMSNVNLNGPEYPTVVAAAAAPVPGHQFATVTTGTEREGRRRSYEDPGPGTALMNARRHATAFVPVPSSAMFKPIVQLPPSTIVPSHPLGHVPLSSAQSFTSQASLSTPYAATIDRADRAATRHGGPYQPPVVSQPQPVRHRPVLPGKAGSYGSSRSPSSEGLMRGAVAVAPLNGAGLVSRSSPPYFKQPPSASSKLQLNMRQPSTAAASLPIPHTQYDQQHHSVSPLHQRLVTHTPQHPHLPTVVAAQQQLQYPFQYYPSLPTNGAAGPTPPNVTANHVAPVSAAIEYYRLAFESQTADAGYTVPPGLPCAPPRPQHAVEEGPPAVDYHGLFALKCHSELSTVPIVGGFPGSPMANCSPQSSNPTSVSSPSTSFDEDSGFSAVVGHEMAQQQPPQQQPHQHVMHVTRSCPSSPNSAQCHRSSSEIGPKGRPEGRRRARRDEYDEGADKIRVLANTPFADSLLADRDDCQRMEVCSDGGGDTDGATIVDSDDQPKDFSMKSVVYGGQQSLLESGASRARPPQQDHPADHDRSRKELKTAPKKKWIRHYMKGK